MTATLERYMTRHPHAVRVDETVAAAGALMNRYGVRHLPVLDGAALVGVLSERDVRLATSANIGRLKVSAVCVDDPYAVDVDTGLFIVAQAMAEKHIGSAIVLDHGKVVGIFTTTDACRALAETLAPAPGST